MELQSYCTVRCSRGSGGKARFVDVLMSWNRRWDPPSREKKTHIPIYKRKGAFYQKEVSAGGAAWAHSGGVLGACVFVRAWVGSSRSQDKRGLTEERGKNGRRERHFDLWDTYWRETLREGVSYRRLVRQEPLREGKKPAGTLLRWDLPAKEEAIEVEAAEGGTSGIWGREEWAEGEHRKLKGPPEKVREIQWQREMGSIVPITMEGGVTSNDSFFFRKIFFTQLKGLKRKLLIDHYWPTGWKVKIFLFIYGKRV